MEKKSRRHRSRTQATLMEQEAHKKLFPIGRENGIHCTTAMKWYRSGKDKIHKERL